MISQGTRSRLRDISRRNVRLRAILAGLIIMVALWGIISMARATASAEPGEQAAAQQATYDKIGVLSKPSGVTGNVRSVAATGDYAYMAAVQGTDGTLMTYDISSVTAGSFVTIDSPVATQAVTVASGLVRDGSTLYLYGYGGVQPVDISVPDAPVVGTVTDDPDVNIYNAILYDGYLIGAADGALVVYDLGISGPTLVETATVGSENWAYSVAVLTDGVLMAGHFARFSGGTTGYSIFEYTALDDLGSPTVTTPSALNYHLEVFGDRLVGCTDNNLALWDVSSPTSPSLLTSTAVNSARACIRDGDNLVTNGHVHTVSGDTFSQVATFEQDNTLSDGFPYKGTAEGGFVFLPQTSRVLVLDGETPSPSAPEFELTPDWGGLDIFIGARSLEANGTCDWEPGETVELWWDDPSVGLASFTTDSDGCFDERVRLTESEQLAGSSPGLHNVTAHGSASPDGQASFEQRAAALLLSPEEGPGTLPVSIQGDGWHGFTAVNVFWLATGDLVAKANVDGSGTISTTGAIPSTRTEGLYVLVGTAESSVTPGVRPPDSSAAAFWLRNPTVELTPPEGPPGARVPVAGCYWFPDEAIAFSWLDTGDVFDSLGTDGTGCIEPRTTGTDPWPDPWLDIPTAVSTGTKTIRATGLDSGMGLNVSFDVISRTLTFEPGSGVPGETLSASGCGWVGNNQVTLEWGYPDSNSQPILWNATVDPVTGCFARDIDVPANSPAEAIDVTAEGDNAGLVTSSFTVEHPGTISISSADEDVEAGQPIEVSISGAIIGESIDFLWDDEVVIHGVGAATSEFSTTLMIPHTASTGFHDIVADGTKGFDDRVEVFVLDRSSVAIDTPGPIYPGMTLEISGDNWAYDERVTLGLRNTGDLSFTVLELFTVPVGSHSFSTSAAIPPDLVLPDGETDKMYVLEASGNKGRNAETTLTMPTPAFSLAARYADPVPILDGRLDTGEWNLSEQISLAQGSLTALSDDNRLYILFNLPSDDVEDALGEGSDNFWLSFDVQRQGVIDPGLDLNVRLDGAGELVLESYQGPDSLALEPVSFMRSAATAGFGCFFADGTLSFTGALDIDCDPHRVWEIGIDLPTIDAEAGDRVRVAMRLQSADPAFQEDKPTGFTSDFDHFGVIDLAPSQLPDSPATGVVDDIGVGGFDIEVTQAVQEEDNSLGLVADKASVVRVYPRVTSTSMLRVFLEGERDGVLLPGSPLVTLATIPPSAEVDRKNLDDTANFLLPASWQSAGTTKFRAQAENLDGASTVSSLQRAVAFTPKESLLIWTIPINEGTVEDPLLPDPAAVRRQETALETLLPISEVRWQRKPWSVLTATGAITTGVAKQRIKDYYDELELSWASSSAPVERPDIIYGHLPSCDADGTIGTSDPVWNGGEGVVAVGCPSNSKRANMAHEVNHNLDRRPRADATWGRHIGGCGAEQGDSSWPWLTGTLTTTINSVGFDVRLPWDQGQAGPNVTVFTPDWPEFMSYCRTSVTKQPTQWISAYRWEQMFGAFPALGSAALAARQAAAEDVLYVSGRLREDGTGTLDPVLVQPGLPSETISPGEYSLELQDSAGTALVTVPFFASFTGVEGQALSGVPFSYRLPVMSGIQRIVLKHGTETLDTIVASASSPTVAVTSPSGGEDWTGGGLVEWEATDPDGDALTFTLLYSPDGGEKWYPIASGLAGSSVPVEVDTLPGGEQGKVRVVATDGFHTVHDDSAGFFSVPEPPALMSIQSPIDGDTYASTERIELEGSANTVGGRTFADNQLTWSVNGEPVALGPAAQLHLAPGFHQVTLRAIAGGSVEGEESVRILVEPPEGFPSVYLPLVLR